MPDYLVILLEFVAVYIIADFLAKYAIKDRQKKCCPYCSCRHRCKHGYGVEQKCDDEELRPLVCCRR